MNKGKKFVSLFLVFSLLALSGNLIAKERRGAKLVIQKKDGQEVSGELIAVKKNSLIMLVSGADASIDIQDIAVIKIVKKSKLWKGAGLGLLLGGLGGAMFADATTDPEERGDFFNPPPRRVINRKSDYITGCAISLAIIGGIAGLLDGKDKINQIEGKSDLEVKKALEKLRPKARIPDYE
ncbi:MAG: hypothetical protein AMJ89_00540 [candidate division Zixibacteria bacterium SM23_73]|nr:MAG: hypothetical protein AMJ89_00540 [candidate division Zixibacteria bacterium SM23_73]